MEYDIFISYSHTDAEIAASIVTQLNSAGYSCFMAEKDITPAQEWGAKIHEALIKSKLLFILITPRSKNSLWVAAEAGAAWALKKQVIPALMFVEPSELIEIINRWQSFSVETSTQIDQLIRKLPLNNHVEISSKNDLKIEKFTDIDTWSHLLKIGEWEYDPLNKLITGKGSYRYLLSNNKYGSRSFTINTQILFREYEHSSLGLNAGIVLGWNNKGITPSYHHLLFTGEKIILEVIGNNGEREYLDFKHLDSGVDFILELEKKYNIVLSFHDHNLHVIIDGIALYSVYIERGITGNVGLRPWRSQMDCYSFKVYEIEGES